MIKVVFRIGLWDFNYYLIVLFIGKEIKNYIGNVYVSVKKLMKVIDKIKYTVSNCWLFFICDVENVNAMIIL